MVGCEMSCHVTCFFVSCDVVSCDVMSSDVT